MAQATQAQYDAATKALETFAYNQINAQMSAEPFLKGMIPRAQQMADQMCPQADAALAVTE